MTHAGRVARNILDHHGRSGLTKLVSMLERQVSHREIARVFGVSKQRVSQWATSLGFTFKIYQLHPDIEKISREPALAEARTLAR